MFAGARRLTGGAAVVLDEDLHHAPFTVVDRLTLMRIPQGRHAKKLVQSHNVGTGALIFSRTWSQTVT